ncbi:MAG: steroid-24-oyl-CoA synthetase [Mycobacterium sp.]|nr:steroid-24-oyl-CoA synthetase [Mycobacterium sp.]
MPDLTAPWGTRIVTEQVLGVRCKVFEPRPRSLADLLVDADRFGDRRHVIQGERSLTFDQLLGATASFAAQLRSRYSLVRGDRVLLLGSNSIEWIVMFWTCVSQGWVVCTGNAWWSRDVVAEVVGTLAPRLVVADERRLPLVPHDVAMIRFDDLSLTDVDSVEGQVFDGDEDDPAVIVFTSGTTGGPKGAVLSHRNLIASTQNSLVNSRQLPARGDSSPRTSLVSVPLFHVGAVQQLLLAIFAGGTMAFLKGRFDPHEVIRLFGEEKVAAWSAVPTMVSRTLDAMEEAPGDSADGLVLRSLAMGAAPVPSGLWDRVAAYFPNVKRGAMVSYGLTEAAGAVAVASGQELTDHTGSVGRPLPTIELAIATPDSDGAGEILVRGPSVMLGYWHEPKSSVITPDRWLRTGDLGRIDNDGYLYLTGRGKDVVIRGGENIAASRVEARLQEHPAVLDVAVIGLPHVDLGEEVAAAIVLRHNAIAAEAELVAFATEGLAYFEVPTRWSISHADLPRTASGKVVKREVATSRSFGCGAASPPR